MGKHSTIRAILRAARHVCEQKFDEAARGEASRAHVFVATLVLEAAYAYLRIYDPPEALELEHLHIRSQTQTFEFRPEASCDHSDYGPN